MRVKCRHTKLTKELIKKYHLTVSEEIEYHDLVVDELYIVVGIMCNSSIEGFEGATFFEIDHGTHFPHSFPSFLFHIVDNRVSKYWEVRDIDNDGVLTLWPPAFYEEDFFDRLDTFEKDAIQKYNDILDEIYFEYPNDVEYQTATIVEDKWVQCPYCMDAWQEFSIEGIIRCHNESCQKFLNNPLFSNTTFDYKNMIHS